VASKLVIQNRKNTAKLDTTDNETNRSTIAPFL
jgi:hypothetical protein